MLSLSEIPIFHYHQLSFPLSLDVTAVFELVVLAGGKGGGGEGYN